MLRKDEEELVDTVRNSTMILRRICFTFVKDVKEYLKKIEEAVNSITVDDGD